MASEIKAAVKHPTKHILTIFALLLLAGLIWFIAKVSGIFGFSCMIEPYVWIAGSTSLPEFFFAGATAGGEVDFSLVTQGSAVALTSSHTADGSGRGNGALGTVLPNGSSLGKGMQVLTITDKTTGKTTAASFYVI